ncbi:unnamed protein product [Cuscuta europaea]|uniref:Uncharacterized protein n=1 Tax=Cuscuta europaea TaxID=41803 RepID=A0A9P0Z401_CUSEU|nr:unnamed protein product [Cuscuta europaea]
MCCHPPCIRTKEVDVAPLNPSHDLSSCRRTVPDFQVKRSCYSHASTALASRLDLGNPETGSSKVTQSKAVLPFDFQLEICQPSRQEFHIGEVSLAFVSLQRHHGP